MYIFLECVKNWPLATAEIRKCVFSNHENTGLPEGIFSDQKSQLG
jgi:hypothetical protein